MSWASGIIVPGPSTYHTLGSRTVGEIRNKVIKQSGRNAASRLFHAGNDKDIIAAWKSELNRILVVFNVCSFRSCSDLANCPLQTGLALNTHTIITDIHQNLLKTREGTDRLVSETRVPHLH